MVKKRNVKIHFDFYEINDASSKESFKEVLDKLSTMRDNERNIEIFGEDIRIEAFSVDDGSNHYKASFVKLRPLEKISTYKLDGKGREIPLEDDEFVGEEVSFYYDPSLKVLVLQKNKYGVSAAGVEEYFQKFLKNDHIKILPMFTLDTYKKLLNQKEITYVETDVSIPSEKILEEEVEGWAFGDVRKLREELGAMKIGLTLTVEDSRKSKLDFNMATRLVKGLLKHTGTNRLKTKARKETGARLEEINLFEDLIRITYNRTLPVGSKFTIETMQLLAEQAYVDKKGEVVELLQSKRKREV
ncbi:hypothetical protein MUO14_24040 [Halobacillus shinanisalinarum]|uniref:DUF4868 domain-containing protein n=1 Tax=Halobacillus shinanisalinarum TaxID=2932258 RepID=A0ABY4GZ08_9BACI|nr:DUF6731 family protein [Halobacillus shinanisalinarum]UOQ93403.1 hypothetical protein MUO14_24040 [Halobacillus shinanisalinarum]